MACVLMACCHPTGVPKPVLPKGETGPPWFADVTAESGIDFIHDPGPLDGSYFFPQTVGSGVALFDFDNDGRLDIYLMHNAGPKSKSKNKLFHQQPDGTFKDVSAGSGLDIAGFGMGVVFKKLNAEQAATLSVWLDELARKLD